MEDGEEGHFDAEKHSRDADFDIWCLDLGAVVDGTRAGEEGDEDCLPETEEDD